MAGMGRWARAARRGGRGAWRRALPAVFLLLSLAVASAGTFQAWRAERSHRDTATGVLTEYAGMVAFNFERGAAEVIDGTLDASFNVVRQNRNYAEGRATAACLLELLSETRGCDCGRSVAGAWSMFTNLRDPVASAEFAGDLPPERARLETVAMIRRHARAEYGRSRHAVVETPDGTLLAYLRLAPPARLEGRRDAELEASRDTLVYAFEIDRTRLSEEFDRVFDKQQLLPPSLIGELENRRALQVEYLTPGGTPLWSSAPGTEHAFPADAPIRDPHGGGVVRASVLPEFADQLIIGGLPADRTPVLLLIVLLSAALAAAAIVQLRRENRLAALRQDFVASVSHELRTPLAQVRLFTETLRLGRTRSAKEEAWALENIERETRRLSHLVENILHFSRSERGVRATDREEADLAHDVGETIQQFSPLVPAHKATFECDVSTGLVAAVHRDSIRQVLLNFLDNAVRYGPAGQTVRVVGRKVGDRIRLAVEDQGAGVAESERERIFEPFQRGQGAVGSVVAGSGIGLSVVREIAEAHDGRAWVEDAPTGGARFVLELPAVHTATERHFAGAAAGAPRGESGVA